MPIKYVPPISVELKEYDSWSEATRLKRVKDILLEYLEPKPQYSGISAHEIAVKIVDEVKV